MASTTKRGPWELVVVYHPETGFIYTIMRDKRYRELHASIRKRNHMHYVDLLARHLHPDLLSPVGQTELEPVYFSDEDKLAFNVQKLLGNLLAEKAIIKRHVLILFETEGYTLTHIRAIMVDSNLDVVAEQNWTNYIPVQESVITDKVDDPTSPANAPSRGLKLTQKAHEKKKLAKKRKEEAQEK